MNEELRFPRGPALINSGSTEDRFLQLSWLELALVYRSLLLRCLDALVFGVPVNLIACESAYL